MNPYIVLGVPPDATLPQIKAAWRRLSRKHHPDRKGGSHDKQAQVNDAYKILSDPERRARWDLTGDDVPIQPMDVVARGVILQMISQVIAQPFEVDIYTAVSKSLAANCETARGKLRQVEAKKASLAKHRKKTKVKPGGGFITDLFDQLERGIEETAGTVDLEIKTLTRAAEMFREACDPADPLSGGASPKLDPIAALMEFHSAFGGRP